MTFEPFHLPSYLPPFPTCLGFFLPPPHSSLRPSPSSLLPPLLFSQPQVSSFSILKLCSAYTVVHHPLSTQLLSLFISVKELSNNFGICFDFGFFCDRHSSFFSGCVALLSLFSSLDDGFLGGFFGLPTLSFSEVSVLLLFLGFFFRVNHGFLKVSLPTRLYPRSWLECDLRLQIKSSPRPSWES